MKKEQGADKRQKPNKTNLNFTIDFVGFMLMLLMIGTGLIIRYVLPPGSGGRGGGHGLLLWGMDRHEWGGLHFWLSIVLLVLLVVHVALHWPWVCNFVRRRALPNRSAGKLSQRALIAFGVVFFLVLNISMLWFIWASNSNVFESDNRDQYFTPAANKIAKRKWERQPDEHKIGESSGDEVRGAVLKAEHDCEREKGKRPRIRRGQEKKERNRRYQREKNWDSRASRRFLSVRRNANRSMRSESRYEDEGRIRGYMTLREVSDETGISVEALKTSLNLPLKISASERLGRLKRRYGFQVEDVRKIATAHKQR